MAIAMHVSRSVAVQAAPHAAMLPLATAVCLPHVHLIFHGVLFVSGPACDWVGAVNALIQVADFGLAKSSNDSAPNSCVGSPNFMGE